MLHWNLFHKHGPMCAIRGPTCLWECVLMAFAHLKLDPKSHILFFFRCIYDAFYLFSVLYGSIAFFVFLSRPFFPISSQGSDGIFGRKVSRSSPTACLEQWVRRVHTPFIQSIWKTMICEFIICLAKSEFLKILFFFST